MIAFATIVTVWMLLRRPAREERLVLQRLARRVKA
jgi:hypothetical protein